jgi:hypothetical protein
MLAIAAAATSHGARSTRMAKHAIAKHRLRDCQSGTPPTSLALCLRESFTCPVLVEGGRCKDAAALALP